MALSPRTTRTVRWGVVALAACVSAAVPAVSAPAPAPRVAAPAVVPSPDSVRSGFAGGKWGDQTADEAAKDNYGNNAASKDPGSISHR